MRIRLALSLIITLLVPWGAGSAHADPGEYGLASVDASVSTDQAGAHPDFTLAFKLKTEESTGFLPATTRDISIALPPGLLANPNAVTKCSAAQLIGTDVGSNSNETGCPVSSQAGVSEVELFKEGNLVKLFEPVYNMESPGGDTVARLGFIGFSYPVFINARLRSEGDYGATATVEGTASLIPLLAANTTLWGVPADESHDEQRITPYEAIQHSGVPETPDGKRSSGLSLAPFVDNPTRCAGPGVVTVTATSYALPDQPSELSATLPPTVGCGQLSFKPTFTATPTSREAASPTGLEADLRIPQDETPQGRSTSQLRSAKVILPQGMTIAAGAADGLQACSAEQVGFERFEESHCPEAAKIGSAEIDSPALPRVLEGAVYQRTPVTGDLFGIWLVTDELGVHLKLPGEVKADEHTGQISATFDGVPAAEGIPQAPVREFRLDFKAGSRAPLATPQACGTYQTHYEFTPWSGGPTVVQDTPMTIDRNCATGGFAPKLDAGPINPVAGAFSPFVTELGRESNEQNISELAVTLPKGVLAKLAGVPLCEGAAAQSGACPAASQVGTATVASGPGSTPLWIPQPGKDPTAVYLSGPYKGAPYSIVVKTPAQAGPFDLGTVVTRAAIDVDRETALATISSDPLPQILKGVPITYRTIHVDVNRQEFTLNPTSCGEHTVKARVTSALGAVATPTSSFKAAGCRELGFRPRLSMRLFGKTNRGAHPRFRAVLQARPGDANIGRAQVALPRSEFIENAHFNTICTRVQFAANQCPAGSIYGHAKAVTPILDQPLEGPVYLRSSSHELPDLVVALKGQVEVDLVGRVDSFRGGIRTTFESVPDAPVTKFTLGMLGGKKGLFVNSRSLCAAPARADAKFTAQNGKKADLSPLLKNDCGKGSARRQSR